MPSKKPRTNKTKDQIAAEIAHVQKVNRDKTLVKLMFPLIEGQKSVYDAQTVVNALSGFIKARLDEKAAELLIKDLNLDLSKEEDSLIKTAILNLIDMLAIEKAKDTASLLERLGNTFAQFGANEYLKQPMSVIKITDIIAE